MDIKLTTQLRHHIAEKDGTIITALANVIERFNSQINLLIEKVASLPASEDTITLTTVEENPSVIEANVF